MADRKFLLRRARIALGVLALAFVVYSGQTSVVAAAHAAGSVQVAFLQGEQLSVVSRSGATPAQAVHALLAGPTAAERKRGFRTYLAAGTKLHRLGVSGSLATVDLNQAFAAGTTERRAARLAQLVRTLTGLDGITRVQVLVNGSPPLGLVEGVSLARPITLRLLETPNVPVPVPPQPRLPAPDAATQTLQQQLIDLGYLLPGDDDGRFGPATSDALLTFQKVGAPQPHGHARCNDDGTPRNGNSATAGLDRRAGQTGRDPARPTGRAPDQRQQRGARHLSLDRKGDDPDTARRLPRVRKDPALVVDPVPRVAAVGDPFRRRHRIPPIRRRPHLPSLTRLRPPAPERCAMDVRLLLRRDARQGDREVLSDGCSRASTGESRAAAKG